LNADRLVRLLELLGLLVDQLELVLGIGLLDRDRDDPGRDLVAQLAPVGLGANRDRRRDLELDLVDVDDRSRS